ncbi:MAG: hypothetical protein LUE65_10440 [Clostridiales bacterium]|nr:hypothetical protein [Clostridiales bacterium]
MPDHIAEHGDLVIYVFMGETAGVEDGDSNAAPGEHAAFLSMDKGFGVIHKGILRWLRFNL